MVSESRFHVVRHPDDSFYDDVQITVVERYKTSGLSGDEWRFSYLIELRRKGVTVAKRPVGSMAYAVVAAAAAVQVGFAELEMDPMWETVPWSQVPNEGFCCQPGCKEKATSTYAMKKLFADGNTFEKPNGEDGVTSVREFCRRHRRRGDCGLDDADSNYEVQTKRGKR